MSDNGRSSFVRDAVVLMLAVLMFRRGIVGFAMPGRKNPATSSNSDDAESSRVASHT